jgi:succinoglycan biosynthesis transport protein ExoP
MLQINRLQPSGHNPVHVLETITAAEFYAASVGFLRRQFPIVVAIALLGITLGALYLHVMPATYTGRAVLIVNAPNVQLFQSQGQHDQAIDSATVDTQIQILTSDDIALSIIKNLHLADVSEFRSDQGGILGRLVGYFEHSEENPGSDDTVDNYLALRNFQSRLRVKRVGLTYAIEINFDSSSPYRAAQIANALADSYAVNAFAAKYQITGQAATWLQDRLKELRDQASDAERAVVDYKVKNHIVDTGGRLMNEQQLAELNSELIQARTSTAEAKARFDRVQEIVASKEIDPAMAATATVTDTLHNDVINKMREKYLDDERRVAEWGAQLGQNHMAVVTLRNQMNDLRSTIFQELKRVAEGYKSDLLIARSREQSIQESLDQIVAESQSTDQARVTLHTLQSSAQTYRDLYDNFLQRYMQSIQQQSSPVTESRLITHARPPLTKSAPKPLLVMALAALGGLIFGGAAGMLRDISDRVFRTTVQISEHLQVGCVAVIPLVKEIAGPNAAFQKAKAIAAAVPTNGGTNRAISISNNISSRIFRLPTLRARQFLTLPKRRRRRRRRTLNLDKSVCWTVANAPLSRFTESIRAVKLAADNGGVLKENKVIGITSSLPNEGKSTVAISLAALIAQAGGRAILVDCDLRNPALSRMLTPESKVGLLEIIKGKSELEDVLWQEPATGLAFLPAVVTSDSPHSSDVLASQEIRALFERLRGSYDYVIIDLSPLAPVVDARVTASLVDAYLFVVEWGRTKIEVARLALNNAPGISENIVGIVLNKADMKTFGRYANYQDNYYNNANYTRYGYTE